MSTWTAQIEGLLASDVDNFGADGRWYAGRPLLVTENDYELRLQNGDTGVVIETGTDGVSAAFERRGEILEVSPTKLGAVDTVYAMTIHKSQGSQFETAAVLLPAPTSRILSRELLYTAATRARELLILAGTEEAIRAAVARPVARASGLRWRLWGDEADLVSPAAFAGSIRPAVEIIPDKRKVIGLVEQAREGKICLPNFQRDFVWSREEVADLVRSIVRGYFIGSLLLLRCDPHKPPFAPVFLRGSEPAVREPRPELLILDGQQRLSSLIYALTAPDLSLKDSNQRRWFFVNLDVLLREPDSDDVVFDRSKRELRGLDLEEAQYEQRMLPCTVLLTQQRFFRWRDGFEDWLRTTNPDKLDRYRSEWRDGWTSAVTAFQTFEAPLVELPRVDDSDSESIGRVCAIFEKLNSTGVDLSVYDLLTARLYRSGIRLHDLWAESVHAHPRLMEWSKGKAHEHKFGVLVLRTLALLRGLDPKPRILIDLSPEHFVEDWRRAAAAIDRALELTTLVGPDGFGVFARKWLPGFGLIPILAALRAEIEERKLGEQERADLRRWYWCNVFLERYSSAVESKSRKDYVEMTRHWFEEGPEPEVFLEAANGIGAPGFRIRDSASYASARYSGVFCLLALRNARDWRRGEDIRLQELQDHHIFPQAYLKRHAIKKRVDLNTIANRTLISNETNGKIKDKAPAEYISDNGIVPSGTRGDLLGPHFIDDGMVTVLQASPEGLPDEEVADLYNSFIQARQAAMIEEIRRPCMFRG